MKTRRQRFGELLAVVKTVIPDPDRAEKLTTEIMLRWSLSETPSMYRVRCPACGQYWNTLRRPRKDRPLYCESCRPGEWARIKREWHERSKAEERRSG